jgi:hypothetical protein
VPEYTSATWWKPWTWNHVERIQVIRQPEFNAADVALMAGDLLYRESLGPHGIPMDRATAKDARFVASEIPTHDKAAKAIAKSQQKYYDSYPDELRDGDLWSVQEVTD